MTQDMTRNMHVYSKFTDMFKYLIKGTYVLQKLLFLVVLMTLGITSSWAQTNYSGTYYIANNADYNSGNPANNWYLVPADDGTESKNYKDAYYSADQYKTLGDPEKPFLTTYKTNKDNAANPKRKDNSIWILEPVTGESGYYYIKHAATGKYVIYEPPHTAKPNRKSVHLLTTDSPGENAKFEIKTNGNIRPKSISTLIMPLVEPTAMQLNIMALLGFGVLQTVIQYGNSRKQYFRLPSHTMKKLVRRPLPL